MLVVERLAGDLEIEIWLLIFNYSLAVERSDSQKVVKKKNLN
jgi:hypothetical protein